MHRCGSSARRLLLALSLVALALPAWSPRAVAQPVGGYAGSILRRPMLAQEIALGGVYTSFSPDGSAIFSNAAALAYLHRPSFTASASSTSLGLLRTALLGFGMSIGRYGGIGIGVTSVGTGDQAAYNGNFSRIGTVSNPHLSVAIGAGLPIGPGSIGATLHYLRQDVLLDGAGTVGASGGDNGYSLDISGTLTFQQRLFIALSLNDVAGELVSSENSAVRETIPWNARLSATYLHPIEERTEFIRPNPTGAEIVRHLKPATYWLGAIETQMSEVNAVAVVGLAFEIVPVAGLDLGFRAGYNSMNDISGGFLYRIPVEFTRELRLDYAVRREYERGDITHHITLTAEF